MIHKRKTAALLWPRYSWAVDSINSNARLKAWHTANLNGRPHFPTRFEMHRYVREQLSEPLDYLEFGVWKGNSLRLWTEIAPDPQSRFFGFDTFTGLPEKWEMGANSLEAGTFKVDELPIFADPRVTLVKGLFQDTLRPFVRDFKRSQRMVVHCDADLYSSTLFTLSVLAETLRPGDIIIFDEFSQPLHEFRALIDWAQSFCMKYRGVASSGDFHCQVAIEIIE